MLRNYKHKRNPGYNYEGIKYYFHDKQIKYVADLVEEGFINNRPKKYSYIFNKITDSIKQVSKIITKKFPTIRNKTPTILFVSHGFEAGVFASSELDLHIIADGEYLYNENLIKINYDTTYYTMIKNIFHEIGHFLYRKYLSTDAILFYINYITLNSKQITLDSIIDVYDKFNQQENVINKKLIKIRKQIYQLEQQILDSQNEHYDDENYEENYDLENDIYDLQSKIYDLEIERSSFEIQYPVENNIINKIKEYFDVDIKNEDINPINIKRIEYYLNMFSKPSSDYNKNMEEIFCEIFANYMMYGSNYIHIDNFKMLRTMIPELRN